MCGCVRQTACPAVSLPRPASPLLDLSVIVGSEAAVGRLMGMFRGGGTTEEEAWPALKWFQEKWYLALI